MILKEIKNYPRKKKNKVYDDLRISVLKKDGLKEGPIYLITTEEYNEIQKLKNHVGNPTGISPEEKKEYENQISQLQLQLEDNKNKLATAENENRKLGQEIEEKDNLIKVKNNESDITDLKNEINNLKEQYEKINKEHIDKLTELEEEFKKNDKLHIEKEQLLKEIKDLDKKYYQQTNILVRMMEALMNKIENQSFTDRVFRHNKLLEYIEEDKEKLLPYKNENKNVKETYMVKEK